MTEANYDEVICPNCVTQFRAIPVNVQDQIIALTAERDEWQARCEFSFTQRDKLTAERDAYAKAADEMAMSHKVERDALKDAAKLVLKALKRIDDADIRLDHGEQLSITKAIAALKAVLK